MKVIEEEKPRKLTYPLIAKSIHTGAILVFATIREGTVLFPGTGVAKIGEHHSMWNEVTNSEDWIILDDVTIQFSL